LEIIVLAGVLIYFAFFQEENVLLNTNQQQASYSLYTTNQDVTTGKTISLFNRVIIGYVIVFTLFIILTNIFYYYSNNSSIISILRSISYDQSIVLFLSLTVFMIIIAPYVILLITIFNRYFFQIMNCIFHFIGYRMDYTAAPIFQNTWTLPFFHLLMLLIQPLNESMNSNNKPTNILNDIIF
jgi:hypothetical protein